MPPTQLQPLLKLEGYASALCFLQNSPLAAQAAEAEDVGRGDLPQKQDTAFLKQVVPLVF